MNFLYYYSILVSIFSVLWLIVSRLQTGGLHCQHTYQGGSSSHVGSCWCDTEIKCPCTPGLAIEAIIEVPSTNRAVKHASILLVIRQQPPKGLLAIPGGFVNVGESAETAAIREINEETNLTITHLEQFHFYNDAKRDQRRHSASMIYRGKVADINDLNSGDDAKAVTLIPVTELLRHHFAFDHKQVLTDYLNRYHSYVFA